ncbi:MAG: glycosyltransferase family 4 protein [bacterium]|jgi:glycosyltransferase involved in cell wall biosynthesis
MKVLHCCLSCFYIDNYGYQENLLPKQHKADGHEVAILASTQTFIDNKTLGYVDAGSYISESGIPVTRVPYSRFLPSFIMRRLRIYSGVAEAINKFKPEIIFLHDCQFLDIRHIVNYARRNPGVFVYVDGHTDFINSARNWISKYILHKIIYRHCAKMIEPYATKFYGVLPLRCEFFHDVYGIPKEKIELLVLGAEDNKIHMDQRDSIRERICRELGLGKDDFIVVTGGKLDKHKNTIALLDAVIKVDCERLKLVIFGSMTDDVKPTIEGRLDNPNVKYIGWINADKVYEYFTMADLIIFPGLHSVLWEQAVACGVPCVFMDIEGVHHVDTGGNCIFLKEGSTEDIANALKIITTNKDMYEEMKICALRGASKFLYSEIARQSIRDAL